MEELQPGQVIAPQSAVSQTVPSESPAAPDGSPQPERPSEPPAAPSPAPKPEPSIPAPREETPQEGWQFRSETLPATTMVGAESAPSGKVPLPPAEELTWSASEYIVHEKSAGWYGLLALAAAVAATLVYLLTKDKISTSIVVVAAAVFGTFAHRKPQTQEYSLWPEGLRIGQKLYNLQEFKTFSVAEDGATVSIVFMPLKRFMPPLSIYVVPELEDRVVNFLSAYMPIEQHKPDAIDSLLRRIRF